MKLFCLRLSVLSIISLSIFLYSCSYSSKAAGKLLNKAKTKSYDMIVVPGVPFNSPTWDRVMRGRVYWSKYLYNLGIAKNVMYSGAPVGSPYAEGEIMALYAAAIGIPKEHIFTETKAEHSTENIYYSYKKAKKLGFQTIALASDHFQTKSLRRFVRKRVSPDVGLIPFVMPIIRKMDPEMQSPAIDFQQFFIKDFIPLNKRQSFWKRLKGTRGKNIDNQLYN